MSGRAWLLGTLVTLSACGGSTGGGAVDAGPADAMAPAFDARKRPPDAGRADAAGPPDAARTPPDAARPDAAAADAAAPDAAAPDAAEADAETPDAATPDAARPDAGSTPCTVADVGKPCGTSLFECQSRTVCENGVLV